MNRQAVPSAQSPKAARSDLARILGDLEDAQFAEILTLQPTLAEVEQAALWVGGEGEVLSASGHTLSGVAAEIVDIVTADEEDEEPPRASNS